VDGLDVTWTVVQAVPACSPPPYSSCTQGAGRREILPRSAGHPQEDFSQWIKSIQMMFKVNHSPDVWEKAPERWCALSVLRAWIRSCEQANNKPRNLARLRAPCPHLPGYRSAPAHPVSETLFSTAVKLHITFCITRFERQSWI
jgi:hypothetical protein